MIVGFLGEVRVSGLNVAKEGNKFRFGLDSNLKNRINSVWFEMD